MPSAIASVNKDETVLRFTKSLAIIAFNLFMCAIIKCCKNNKTFPDKKVVLKIDKVEFLCKGTFNYIESFKDFSLF